jgi:hypothetical protein
VTIQKQLSPILIRLSKPTADLGGHAVSPKAYVCGRFIAGIARSNPADGIYVHLLCLLCVVL